MALFKTKTKQTDTVRDNQSPTIDLGNYAGNCHKYYGKSNIDKSFIKEEM